MSDPEFEALLDKMAEEMELQEKEDEDVPLERHAWEMQRQTEFSNDVSKYECGKCGAKLDVRQDQSIASAREEHGILENCVEHAVQAVSEF